jgi:hypothetical protein
MRTENRLFCGQEKHGSGTERSYVRFMASSPLPQELSDQALLLKAAELAQHERIATTELIAALAEIDVRKLYLGQGCSSMFTYCTGVLHLSEHAAYDRIEAARHCQAFPVVLDRLRCGALTLTNLRLLGPLLNSETVEPLLDAAAYKSKHDVEALVRPRRTEAGDIETYTIQITLSADALGMLRRAQEVLRHVVPDGNPGTIVERSLTVLLEQVDRKKLGSTKLRRQAQRTTRRSRHVPLHIRRDVWKRDGGQCAFVGDQGRRCVERGFLEFHHLVPYALGGKAVVENLELRCRAHNQHEAEIVFGPRVAGTDGGIAANELVPGPVKLVPGPVKDEFDEAPMI